MNDLIFTLSTCLGKRNILILLPDPHCQVHLMYNNKQIKMHPTKLKRVRQGEHLYRQLTVFNSLWPPKRCLRMQMQENNSHKHLENKMNITQPYDPPLLLNTPLFTP